jgi:hypothetical protein
MNRNSETRRWIFCAQTELPYSVNSQVAEMKPSALEILAMCCLVRAVTSHGTGGGGGDGMVVIKGKPAPMSLCPP